MMTRLMTATAALCALAALPAQAVDASGAGAQRAELSEDEKAHLELRGAVESYAAIHVVEDDARLVVSDGARATLGSPTPDGPTAGMARLVLETGGCVDVEIDFPTMGGIGGDGGIFGRARGPRGGILGVLPFARAGGEVVAFGDLDAMAGAPDHAPLSLTHGGDRFCEDAYDIHLGVATRWDLTPGRGRGNRFADPGVYSIPVTATIVP